MKHFDRMKESDLKEMFGLGLDSLINRLSLGIASINAGNTSVKLKKEIQSIADILFQKKSAKGNENAIYFQITGKTVDDISHLEKHLLAEFRLFCAEYDLERIKLGRKKFRWEPRSP